MNRINRFVKKHWLLLALLAGAVVLAVGLLVLVCWLLIRPSGQFILNKNDTANVQNKDLRVGLVLGAGVNNQGKPYKELQARLDVAAEALQKKEVQKLLLSGDNRFQNYDEPTAMYDYLVQKKHVVPSKLQRDFAGRSTYESCERANKVFGQNRLLIISASSHLPRAIYLCRHMGVEAYGISSDVEANNSFRRELLARVKAVCNLNIHGEKTVLGPPVKL